MQVECCSVQIASFFQKNLFTVNDILPRWDTQRGQKYRYINWTVNRLKINLKSQFSCSPNMCFTVVRTTFMKDIGCSNVMTTFWDWNNRKTETYKKREINGFCECQHWHWHRIKANHFIYVILQKIRIYLLIKICAWHGVNFSTENARILQHHSFQIFSGHTHTYTLTFSPQIK